MAEVKKTVKKAIKAEKPKIQKKESRIKNQTEGAKDGDLQENSSTPVQTNTETAEKVAKQEPTAKAGKRSPKAIKELEEKQTKEARKASKQSAESEAKPKVKQVRVRSRLERRGKKYQELAKQIDGSKTYSVKEAVDLAIKTSPTKFDATLELHVRLGVDPKQADQNIRGTVVLPAGTGKTLRIAVFADPDDAAETKQAGADIAGTEEITKLLDNEKLDFDILISSPTNMAKLGKYARLLGPRGLMPNPKSGTVTTNVVKAVKEAKSGRVEYRVDSTGIIHVPAGKVSFGTDKLFDNVQALLSSIRSAKPSSVKGTYIVSSYLTTSMGPSVRIQANEG